MRKNTNSGPGFLQWLRAKILAGRMHEELMRMDDRMLEDIGLPRSEIPYRVAEYETRLAKGVRFFSWLRRPFAAMAETWRIGLEIRALSQLDDGALSGMGIGRAEIPRVVLAHVTEDRDGGATALKTSRFSAASQPAKRRDAANDQRHMAA